MTDYKNLTNEELLDPTAIFIIMLQNKKDQKGNESALIEVLEKAISEASESAKPKIQERLDAIKKIFDRK